MTDADMRNEIPELLRQVQREIHDRVRQAFKGSDVPPMGLVLVKKIARHPGLTVSDLSRHTGTVKSHVSKMIDHLVRLGYLEKRPDADDQRLIRIYMTQAAADLVRDLEARALAIWGDVLDQMSEAEMAHVTESLHILMTALRRSERPQSQDG